MNKRVTNFDKYNKYRLYRTVKEILAPSISKLNISNYKIVFDEDLLPVRVFYPDKISDINEVIIYVPGDGRLTKCNEEYTKICEDLAIDLDKLIIAIDYYETTIEYPIILDKIERVITYLYEELDKANIPKDKVTLMGDSLGGNFISSITFRFIKKKINYINKEILIYPVLSGEYSLNSKYDSIKNSLESNKQFINRLRKCMKYYANKEANLQSDDVCPILNKNFNNYPKTLIITGDLDPLRDEGKDFFTKLKNNSVYLNILFAKHGFINTNDFDMRKEYINSIKQFI